jgi:DNA polymerase I-like protein with 3'-5' exonuclease and polymerase domains
MIVNCDAKSLEWVVGAYLSQDQVAIKEIWDEIDQHSLNQKAFGLPSRLIAKVFVFRLMYGGSAYSYANDPDFTDVSRSEKFWQKVIDAFYEKYKGLALWHTKIVQEVTQTGQLVMPTGRIYQFERNWKGDWPVTTIKNYPVQGLGADIMAMIRVSFRKRFHNANIDGLLVNTVHDSIVVDVPEYEIERVVRLFHDVFDGFPTNFRNFFGMDFNLPLRCEVSVGNNMKELVEVK